MMANTSTSLSDVRSFRGTIIVYAFLLGCLSVWVLAAEAVRPPIVGLTTDPQAIALGYQHRDAAVTAARIGHMRGDLWSEAAFAYGNLLWSRDQNALNAPGSSLEQTQSLTQRAIAYAPHDSRLWLLLSAYYFRFGSSDEKMAAALKMSYYTGLNTISIIAERLLLATQSRALDDEEFKELVRHDIRIAAVRQTEFMPALTAAYRNAPSSGREFIEKSLAEIDPSLLASIRAR